MKDTSQQDGLWTIGFGELGATLKALQDWGVKKEHLARLRADPDYAKRVAKFMVWNETEKLSGQELARAILGRNFFGIEEWSFFYGIKFSKKQLRKIPEFPWSEDVLNAPCPFYKDKKIKETHFAFLGLDTFKGEPLNILKWQELHPPTDQPRFYSYAPDNWYAKELFAITLVHTFRWYLMLLEVIPNSSNKTYPEQITMLPIGYEAPQAIEEVTKSILYYQKNGIFLNPIMYGRCRDITSDGLCVSVGHFNWEGLGISNCQGGYRDPIIGIAASRKISQ